MKPARSPSPHLVQPIIEKPISNRDRAFLRMLKNAGGRMQLVRLHDRNCAEVCQEAGYVLISDESRCKIVRLTGRGQAYLHKIMGVH
ncbi:hypothetical protein [Agrobacterium sp. LAD9]|uniref:hypothetical protein n=1 Tax=Agrobacterium sp. LAD9 TaxID=2055153 RepID=UPI000D1F78B4|nr:hypothetical protein [Agrobacterium sp. LAD9]